MTATAATLPAGVHVFERGWLSANNVLVLGRQASALVDSGYWSHSAQTLALVEAALSGRPLDRLLNTHLHSDHCGGNAALQQRYPGLQTLIAPGLAAHVAQWDAQALTYTPTGQHCPPFVFDGLLQPGRTVTLGELHWQIHAAPGHDPHSVVLFEPASATLISADALWGNGFGVIFPELQGEDSFDSVADTLALIESLRPRTVIPGHGAVFQDVAPALARARSRLDSFVRDPARHARHAARVLLKYKLLEFQAIRRADLLAWATATPYFETIRRHHAADTAAALWPEQLLAELLHSGAARHERRSDTDWIINA